jgi:hypothetical protein
MPVHAAAEGAWMNEAVVFDCLLEMPVHAAAEGAWMNEAVVFDCPSYGTPSSHSINHHTCSNSTAIRVPWD